MTVPEKPRMAVPEKPGRENAAVKAGQCGTTGPHGPHRWFEDHPHTGRLTHWCGGDHTEETP